MPTVPPPARTIASPRDAVIRLPGQSLQAFRRLPEGTRAQFFDGDLLMSPAPLLVHQRVVTAIAHRLRTFVLDHDLGEVLVAPVDVSLTETFVVQPDVLFLSHERSEIADREGLRGAPDLVVEVLSPSTAYYDLTIKREAYEAHGVDEYWIVDPERRTVLILVLEDGRYRVHAELRADGAAASARLDGFSIEMASLFVG